MLNNFFENHAIYKLCKNMVDPNGPQMTIWAMRIVYYAGYLRL